MSKSVFSTNPAFEKKEQNSARGFNLINQVNNFNSIFNVKPLDVNESNNIEKLLVENYTPGTKSEEQVSVDITDIKHLTSEIKAIGKQSVVLMGERIAKARDILKPYRDGTFTKWLEATFGNRKHGYNMLAYYSFYTSLPDNETQEKFKQIPHKTAYILASREGEIGKKAEIVRDHYDLSHKEILMLIHEKFPLSKKDKRTKKEANTKIVTDLYAAIRKISKRKEQLSEENKKTLIAAKEILDDILISSNQEVLV